MPASSHRAHVKAIIYLTGSRVTTRLAIFPVWRPGWEAGNGKTGRRLRTPPASSPPPAWRG
jgi:hypothetical protein